jgi:hypothetical protein
MANRSDPYSLPPAVRRVVGAFRLLGWISFWAQIVLAVISAVVLMFAGSSLSLSSASVAPGNPGSASPETGFGLFFAVCGLVILFAGAYWAFRYTRLSRKLKASDAQARPKPRDAIQTLQFGLVINLAGMLLTILGAQAIVGSLVAKSFAQGFAIFSGNPLKFISPLDVFLVQANTNIIMAHFIGVVATLWLLRTINRQ